MCIRDRSDSLGGKLRYVLTSSPLKLLASLALTKKFDPIEKTNRIAKNQSDMVANLFFSDVSKHLV